MFFYGNTSTGHRIHMGNFIMRQRGQQDWVETFCGAEMSAWDQGERPPGSRVADFCRNCFRTYAWQIMVEQVTEAACASTLSDVIDRILADANLTPEQALAEIREAVAIDRVGHEDSLIPPDKAPVKPAPANVVSIKAAG